LGSLKRAAEERMEILEERKAEADALSDKYSSFFV
jgi:hypothetical protein